MTVQVLPFAGIGLEFLGLALHIIGVATPEWSVHDFQDVTYGLWQDCNHTASGCWYTTAEGRDYFDGYIEASEAFAVIGIIFAVAAVISAVLYFLLPKLSRSVSRKYCFISGALAFCAVISILINVVIWGKKVHIDYKESFGYSFALSITGGILLLFGGAMMILGAKQVETLNM